METGGGESHRERKKEKKKKTTLATLIPNYSKELACSLSDLCIRLRRNNITFLAARVERGAKVLGLPLFDQCLGSGSAFAWPLGTSRLAV